MGRKPLQPSSKRARSPVFRAEPETIEVDESGFGETLLTWETPDVAAVEIRVGSSKGKLLGAGGAAGRVQTGRWVNESTRFYLLDPLTGETLAQTGVRTRFQNEPDLQMTELEHKMRQDWNERARDNALYYVATGQSDWSEEEFFRSGRQTVEEFISSDMINICRGRDPKQLKVLEIGCGVGRVTRALAEVFGEVCGVDVSSVMVRKGREYLGSCENVSFFVNNGSDLRVLGDRRFDFALSLLTFQHIPSKAVIENYIAETSRVLRPGALFKFEVQGYGPLRNRGDDTWLGVALTPDEVTAMADSCGFQHRHSYSVGSQYSVHWLFKKGPAALRADPNPAQRCDSRHYRTVLSWDAPAVEQVEVRMGSEAGEACAQGGSLDSQEIECRGREALECYLVDASTNQVLTTLVVQSGRGFWSIPSWIQAQLKAVRR